MFSRQTTSNNDDLVYKCYPPWIYFYIAHTLHTHTPGNEQKGTHAEVKGNNIFLHSRCMQMTNTLIFCCCFLSLQAQLVEKAFEYLPKLCRFFPSFFYQMLFLCYDCIPDYQYAYIWLLAIKRKQMNQFHIVERKLFQELSCFFLSNI